MFQISRPVFILLILIILDYTSAFPQLTASRNLRSPLDIPLSIAGNFGEIRANAFHTGIDFKTMGMIGMNVKAVDDGYVSRIKIEPSGFGKAIYITHSNGYTSVYGHVETLREDMDDYCKEEQYKRKQFSVDLMLKPNEILVKKGDIIALSGNRGGSSGPHLHFEYRETKTEFPVNVFRFTNITIPDSIAPVVDKIWIYPLSVNSRVNNGTNTVSFGVSSSKDKSWINSKNTITASGDIGIGVHAYDQNNRSANKTGPYSLQLYVNQELVFEQVMDKLSFFQQRYINSLIDYENFIRYGVRINRLFVQPNNQLMVYHHLVNRGIINFNDNSAKEIRIVITDDNLNQREFSFTIKGEGKKAGTTSLTKAKPVTGGQFMSYKNENIFTTGEVKLIVPKDALFEDLLFEFIKGTKLPHTYSNVYQIHNSYTALNKSCILSIKPVNLPKELNDKAVIMEIDPEAHVKWCGGEYKDGYVVASIRTFGRYVVGIDTVPPTIKPLFSHVSRKDFSKWDRMAFNIRDDQSGIDSYQAFIDGQWVLLEYDPKMDLAFYQFDPKRMQFGRQHTLDVIVTDERGNKSEYNTEFYK